MTKTIEENFIDWESEAFGFGYGTGEDHTLSALKAFMANIGKGAHSPHAYDYQVLEADLTPTVAWLLINILCRANIIEYGSSPRFGWLAPEGEALKAFVDSKTAEELTVLCCARSNDYIYCSPDSCNCGPEGYEEGRVCENPFWHRRK